MCYQCVKDKFIASDLVRKCFMLSVTCTGILFITFLSKKIYTCRLLDNNCRRSSMRHVDQDINRDSSLTISCEILGKVCPDIDREINYFRFSD